MDNATFGGNIPSLPQWTGAPRGIIHVQAMLYASLAASLFSAFLAMLGKQWLNRYVSIGMRGTAIERSQDRQRKLGGIIIWYFDHVMESLPVMLQVALLLLGCALSFYLWKINVTVACVVLSVTALGVIFYAFVVVAGTASTSCPYQTPVARVLRNILPSISSLLCSAFHDLVDGSKCLILFSSKKWYMWWNWRSNISFLLMYILSFPLNLAYDAFQLSRVMIRALIALAFRIPIWIRSARSIRARGTNQQTAALDSQSISWILQTSLEKGIRLSTLGFLATTPTLADFNPLLVPNCFDIFIDCVNVNKRNAVIVQGMEQLAEASAMCFFLTYSHLSIANPMSSVLADICRHYRRTFPRNLDFGRLPFSHTLGAIHQALYPGWPPIEVPTEWTDHKSTSHLTLAHAFSKLSWSNGQRGSVPRLCLSFALHYLSQDPLPPPSITADCLLIIAIDMGCNVPNTMVLQERYAHTSWISTTLLTNSQRTT